MDKMIKIMNIYNKIKELINFIKKLDYLALILLVAFGLILILISIILKITTILETHIIIKEIIRELLLALGIVFLVVASVETIYHLIIFESHFKDFKNLLTDQLKDMESIQNKCINLGIEEIFKTRDEYEDNYPLSKIIEKYPEGGELTLVAKSMKYLAERRRSLKIGLDKGLTFRLCCIDPSMFDNDLNISDIYYTSKDNIKDAHGRLIELFESLVENEEKKGSIELRYHSDFLPDSAFIFFWKGKEKLALELSFGRSHEDKIIILVNTSELLGKYLKERYLKIYDNSQPIIKYPDIDEVKINEFKKSIESMIYKKVTRLKNVNGRERGENIIPKIIKKAKAGDEIYFVIKTATFNQQVDQEIFTALDKGAKIKMLIPKTIESENQIKKFISHKNIQIHNYNPGRVRLLFMKEEALIGISDPDSHEYSGVYINEHTFSRFLKTSIDKIFEESPTISLVEGEIEVKKMADK